MAQSQWTRTTSRSLWVPEPHRRTVLTGASASAAALLLGCGSSRPPGARPGPEVNDTATSPPDTSATPAPPGQYACTVRPMQTEGPFFSDLKLNRKDIRSDPADNDAVKPGVPLRMVFKVGEIDGMACKAFENVMVDLWQCDAAGVYSGYAQEGTAGKQYLRGYQATDGTGTAEFLTIYPGAYAGRAVHLHFKLRTNPAGQGSAFTSQLYFPEMVNDEIFAQAPYQGSRVRNASDGIFRAGGADLIPKMSKEGMGWLAEFEIGLRMA